ncbi:unnamed protein product [Caenorhabditis auriculariae]|uniref:Lipase n=1 Tax=Caenorhabditis auriculariae TaxID=2777116 RepID=A0A8S1HAI8_9PELO|nr:unnamed protein product [Caenorhabditis auriculariae]
MLPSSIFVVFLTFFNVIFAKDLDAEINMTTPEIIQHWGYPAQIFTATTTDGYILEMHRIPNGKTNVTWPKGKRPVVFMQHGLMGESSNWVDNLPDESAGFLFADAGFDVWLGNMRGETYSTKHVTLDPSQEAFWKFSWDEMAKYDLEAQINKVLEVTGEESIYYIGHSQGTLTMFAHLSQDQGGDFSKKIKKFFALAPIGSVKNIKGALQYLATHYGTDLELYYDLFGTKDVKPSSWVLNWLSDKVCSGIKLEQDLCDDFFFQIMGPESNQWNETRLPVYTSHIAGTSTMNLVHWLQMVQHGGVPMMDYGKKQNIKHYGQDTPPVYDFTKIKNVPVYLYWSEADWLGDATDVTNYLIPKLTTANVIAANNHLPEFNHVDFIWGLRAPKSIYQPIIDISKADFLQS